MPLVLLLANSSVNLSADPDDCDDPVGYLRAGHVVSVSSKNVAFGTGLS